MRANAGAVEQRTQSGNPRIIRQITTRLIAAGIRQGVVFTVGVFEHHAQLISKLHIQHQSRGLKIHLR